MEKTIIEKRVEKELRIIAEKENFKFELLYDKSVEVLGKKIAQYLIEEVVKGNLDTQDLYITYRKREYVVEVSVTECNDTQEVSFSARPLLSYIYEFGNYENEDEYREENEDKIEAWKNFCNKYYY